MTKRSYPPLEMQITDARQIVEIYNEKGDTEYLAKKYSRRYSRKITTSTIARIKGGAGPYFEIIREYKRQLMLYLFQRSFGYDIIQKYYPPPWGKPKEKQPSPEHAHTSEAGEPFKKSA